MYFNPTKEVLKFFHEIQDMLRLYLKSCEITIRLGIRNDCEFIVVMDYKYSLSFFVERVKFTSVNTKLRNNA